MSISFANAVMIILSMVPVLMRNFCCDWHVHMLCSISHGLVINMGSSVLQRLVVNMCLCMFHWFILDMSGIVLMFFFWSVMMRRSNTVLLNWCWNRQVSKWSISHMMIMMFFRLEIVVMIMIIIVLFHVMMFILHNFMMDRFLKNVMTFMILFWNIMEFVDIWQIYVLMLHKCVGLLMINFSWVF